MKTAANISATAIYQKAAAAKHLFWRMNAQAFLFLVKQEKMAWEFIRACL